MDVPQQQEITRQTGTVREVLATAGIDPTTHHIVSVAEVRFSTSKPYPNSIETRDVLVFNHAVINDQQGDDPLSIANYRVLERNWSELHTTSPYVNAKYFAIDMDEVAPEDLVEVIESLENYPVLDDEEMSKAEMDLADEHWDSYGKRDLVEKIAELADMDEFDLDTDVLGEFARDVIAEDPNGELYPEYIDVSAFNFKTDDVAKAVIVRVRTWLATVMGWEHGTAVGSYVIDGNTSEETARRIITGYNDGDPQVMDMCPSPLSGEWCDDPTPARVLGQLGADNDGSADHLLTTYEAAYSDGYWCEVIRSATTIAIEGIRR